MYPVFYPSFILLSIRILISDLSASLPIPLSQSSLLPNPTTPPQVYVIEAVDVVRELEEKRERERIAREAREQARMAAHEKKKQVREGGREWGVDILLWGIFSLLHHS